MENAEPRVKRMEPGGDNLERGKRSLGEPRGETKTLIIRQPIPARIHDEAGEGAKARKRFGEASPQESPSAVLSAACEENHLPAEIASSRKEKLGTEPHRKCGLVDNLEGFKPRDSDALGHSGEGGPQVLLNFSGTEGERRTLRARARVGGSTAQVKREFGDQRVAFPGGQRDDSNGFTQPADEPMESPSGEVLKLICGARRPCAFVADSFLVPVLIFFAAPAPGRERFTRERCLSFRQT